MSALSQLERVALSRLLVLDGQDAGTTTRTPTAEALEASLGDYFEAATEEEFAKGAGVVIAFARRLAQSLSPQAVEEAVVEQRVPVEADVAEGAVEAPVAEGEDGGQA